MTFTCKRIAYGTLRSNRAFPAAWPILSLCALVLTAFTQITLANAGAEDWRFRERRIGDVDLKLADSGRTAVSADFGAIALVTAGKDSEQVVVGKRTHRKYSKVAGLAFAGNSRKVIYWAQRGAKWVLVAGEKESTQEFDEVGEIATSTKSDHVACVGSRGGRWVVVKDGDELAEYEKVGKIALSQDGQFLAVAALRNGRWFCVTFLGAEPTLRGSGYREIGCVAVCPSCRVAGYAARDDSGWNIVLIGPDKETERVASAPYYAVASLVISHEGHSRAYAARKGGKWLVVGPNGEGKPHDGIGHIALSADGQKIAYSTRDGVEWRVIVGDAETQGYSQILNGGYLHFTDDQSGVLFTAEKDYQAYSVEATLSGGSKVADTPQNDPPKRVKVACRGCNCPGSGEGHSCPCSIHMGCMR
ncbi:MAG: hypothetical protein Q7T82_04055 [Armatimonadota bacterium]|nr:hypothetical protein [Armatimonadota bacterium]